MKDRDWQPPGAFVVEVRKQLEHLLSVGPRARPAGLPVLIWEAAGTLVACREPVPAIDARPLEDTIALGEGLAVRIGEAGARLPRLAAEAVVLQLSEEGEDRALWAAEAGEVLRLRHRVAMCDVYARVGRGEGATAARRTLAVARTDVRFFDAVLGTWLWAFAPLKEEARRHLRTVAPEHRKSCPWWGEIEALNPDLVSRAAERAFTGRPPLLPAGFGERYPTFERWLESVARTGATAAEALGGSVGKWLYPDERLAAAGPGSLPDRRLPGAEGTDVFIAQIAVPDERILVQVVDPERPLRGAVTVTWDGRTEKLVRAAPGLYEAEMDPEVLRARRLVVRCGGRTILEIPGTITGSVARGGSRRPRRSR